ncbi:MAG: hypothetical protein IJ706_02595 [Clostridia bacterium]|nr:hypothetical protein [Clostridia bacterium]
MIDEEINKVDDEGEDLVKEGCAVPAYEEKKGIPKGECPVCQTEIYDTKSPCPKCGYKGYFPISKQLAMRIKIPLFITLSVIAVVLIIVLGRR